MLRRYWQNKSCQKYENKSLTLEAIQLVVGLEFNKLNTGFLQFQQEIIKTIDEAEKKFNAKLTSTEELKNCTNIGTKTNYKLERLKENRRTRKGFFNRLLEENLGHDEDGNDRVEDVKNKVKEQNSTGLKKYI